MATDSVVVVDEVTIMQPVKCCQSPNFSYFRTLDGITKLAVVIADLVLLLLAVTHLVNPWYGLLAWASGSALTGSLIITVFYATNSVMTLQSLAGWYRFEFAYCAICVLLFLTTSGAMAYQAVYYYGTVGQSSAAAIFGYMSCLFYGFDGWRKYRSMTSGNLEAEEAYL